MCGGCTCGWPHCCSPHIGAQKAGTDYFFGFVRAAQYHPQIRAAKTKEAHFFSKRCVLLCWWWIHTVLDNRAFHTHTFNHDTTGWTIGTQIGHLKTISGSTLGLHPTTKKPKNAGMLALMCVCIDTSLYYSHYILVFIRWNTVPRQAVRAEITPIYFYHPLVPARVQQYIPEVLVCWCDVMGVMYGTIECMHDAYFTNTSTPGPICGPAA